MVRGCREARCCIAQIASEMLGCQNRKSSVVNLAVAFLFGLISHQVADISWHSMEGLQDGFISALSVLAFHDDWGAAHSYADVADDMIGVFEVSLQ